MLKRKEVNNMPPRGVGYRVKVENPFKVFTRILSYIYKINTWKDAEDFVSQCAKNFGKLVKGGDPDLKAMAKILLTDWQRGKIPFFIPPPKENDGMEIDGNDKEDMNKKYDIEQNVDEIELTKKEYENNNRENEDN